MSITKQKYEFVARLARELPKMPVHQVVALAQKLMSQGSRYGGLAEAFCNGYVVQDEYEARTERIEQRVAKLLEGTGIVVDYQNDPRGVTVRLKFKSGVSNTFGNDGWAVPGS
jgi:hypothetical protein